MQLFESTRFNWHHGIIYSYKLFCRKLGIGFTARTQIKIIYGEFGIFLIFFIKTVSWFQWVFSWVVVDGSIATL